MSGVVNGDDVKSFDELLLNWCGYGRWQFSLLALLSLVFFFAPFFTLSMMFIGATPDYRCIDHLSGNETFTQVQHLSSRCWSGNDSGSISSAKPCSNWVFDNSTFTSTIVTEWQLVCSRRYLLSLAQALVMFGGLVGSIITSQLGDIIGRKPVFMVAIVLFVSDAYVAALTNNMVVFFISRFVAGATISMMIEGEMVIIAELVPPSKRAKFIFLMMAPFPMSITILSALAFMVRDHNTLQLLLAVPTTLLLLNLLVIPESPRWLVQKRKFREAVAVFRSGASWNGRHIESDHQQELLISEMKQVCRMERHSTDEKQNLNAFSAICSNFHELFSTSRMRLNIIITILLRFTACGSYYGLSFDIAQLSNNPFLAVALAALIEVPVYFSFSIINKLGRVKCTAASFAISTFVMFFSFVPVGKTVWLFSCLLAKLSMATSFCMVYIHTPEYLPTPVRALGSALSQTAMRLGGAVAAFVVFLTSKWHPSAPAGIFGTWTLAACVLSLLLPETVNKQLPETVSEVDLLYQTRSTRESLPLQPVPRQN